MHDHRSSENSFYGQESKFGKMETTFNDAFIIHNFGGRWSLFEKRGYAIALLRMELHKLEIFGNDVSMVFTVYYHTWCTESRH